MGISHFGMTGRLMWLDGFCFGTSLGVPIRLPEQIRMVPCHGANGHLFPMNIRPNGVILLSLQGVSCRGKTSKSPPKLARRNQAMVVNRNGAAKRRLHIVTWTVITVATEITLVNTLDVI